MNRLFCLLLVVLIMAACRAPQEAFIRSDQAEWAKTSLPAEPMHTTYLIGDVGEPKPQGQPTHGPLAALKRDLATQNEYSTIVYLGDNIYPKGLPKENTADRAEAEAALNLQLEILHDYKGSAFFVPGNHDWDHSGKDGLKAVKRQETYIEDYFDKYEIEGAFHPDNGCGDPIKVKREKNLVFIFIDSEWYLHNWNLHEHINDGCDIKSRLEFLEKFEELILKNKSKQIVVCMHHPLHTNGNHGGKFSWKQHLFPLLELNSKAFIPMPIIGSLYPAIRSNGGTHQDISHARYQELKTELLERVKKQTNIIFAAGHEHSLQYFPLHQHHFLVSGSGCKTSHIKHGLDAEFTSAQKGYIKLYHYQNGSTWMEIIQADYGEQTRVLYRKEIVPPKPGKSEIELPEYPPLPDSVVAVANADYNISEAGRFWLGDQYRDIWNTPVKARVLNLETEKGGLIPIKKGGGMASNSLRLENPDGKQYALRSINKDMSKAAPPAFQELQIMQLLADQTSAIHPYGAMAVSKLAEAAGTYNITSDLVYLKKQKALGAFNELFPEGLYLLEERPNGDRRELNNFGNSKNIIGYVDLLSKLKKSSKHSVDQDWVLKSRLFDVFIHDWDRHDDQWRWASFETENGTLYRPIARDRDQAFYQFKGALPTLVAYSVMPKFKTFNHKIQDVKNQGFNARYFDRYFLNQLEKEDWLKIVYQLQEDLTDEQIEAAFEVWPKDVYDKSASTTIDKLKSRRDDLDKYALKLYLFLSKEVDVVGTDQQERFDIKRLDNGETNVTVTQIKKSGKLGHILFERTFKKSETREIRLYGLAENDEFYISGKEAKAIRIRIIGGTGKDRLVDESSVRGLSRKTKLYDEIDGVSFTTNGEVQSLVSNNTFVNEYDRKAFKYNGFLPKVYLGITPDDGIWFGGGATITTHGFRKSPYKQQHKLGFKYAPQRGSIVADYSGDFIDAFGRFDFLLEAHIHNPEVVQYFGLGNESVRITTARDFNRVRTRQMRLRPLFKQGFNNERLKLYAGPMYESTRIVNEPSRVIATNDPNITQDLFRRKHFGAAVAGMSYSTVENTAFPEQGIIFNSEIAQYSKLGAGKQSFGTLESSLTFYLTFGSDRPLTIASRTGGGTLWGDPDLLYYHSLGNNNYLRGFRNDRFRGSSFIYNNIDFRWKFKHLDNTYLPMDIGLLAGYDLGRVWLSGEQSNKTHHSLTAGIWVSPLSLFVISPHYSYSREEHQVNLRFGFNF